MSLRYIYPNAHLNHEYQTTGLGQSSASHLHTRTISAEVICLPKYCAYPGLNEKYSYFDFYHCYLDFILYHEIFDMLKIFVVTI